MDVGRLVRRSVEFPMRTAAFGIKTAATVAGFSVDVAAAAGRTAASAGVDAALTGMGLMSGGVGLVTAPLREAVDVPSAVESLVRVALDNAGGPRVRRCCQRSDRAWIEVCGLREEHGEELGRAVLETLRAQPGVEAAHLNFPLSRVFIRRAADGPTCDDLCELVGEAEDRARAQGVDAVPSRAPFLPGDDILLLNRLLSAGITAAGLWGAAAGRALRLPRLPLPLGASVSMLQYQPRLRALLEDRWGEETTGKALGAAKFATRTIGQVPGSHAVALMSRIARTAECRAGQRAWDRYEPRLFEYAECSDVFPLPARFHTRGAVEDHLDRSALAQAVGAAGVGLLTGDPDAAARAALAAVPKAARTAREMFASTLGRGLADDHAVLTMRPTAWRRLDRVDAVVIDPRSLCTTDLRVSRIRGVAEQERAAVWERAQELLEAGKLAAGWQRIEAPGHDPPPEVLIQHVHHGMASAVVAEGRRAGLELVSVDCADLGGLGSGFDELRSQDGGSIDDALGAAVDALHESGRTVAVVSNAAARACAAADIAIGIIDAGCPPPWCADVLADDLTALWWIIHAVPAAKTASRRGVEIATGASLLGALLLVPDVRGRGGGPGPITAGAAAGQWTGYRLARRALRAEVPAPAPPHDWHAMSADQVRRLLPPPSEDATARRANPVEQLAGRITDNISGFGAAMRTELADPLTPVLATGSLASAILGSPIDAILVGSVLVGNATLAATQRIHAERVLGQLLAVQVPTARRIRGSEDIATNADALRPGDIIEVRPDEVVPADARLIDADDIEVDESSLTGESLPVAKHVEATPGAPLAERSCMLYAGSTVVTGTARAVVTAVGAQTQANRAAELASAQQSEVGLQTQLHRLTKRVWPVSMAGGALVTMLGLLRRTRLRDAVSSGVAVAVSAVPEGLPLVATLAQQASARRLTKRGALVRSPRSVEALGRVDVVCFDKTGTLSENRLRVTKVQPADGESPEQVIACAAAATPPTNGRPLQHATDAAIVEAASEYGAATSGSEAVAHLPFRTGRSYSASACGTTLSVKGAPEVVLPACKEPDPAAQRTVRQMAENGLRVIAVASCDLTAEQAEAAAADPDILADYCGDGLRLTGLLGLADTPRAEAPALLAALAERDVGVRLITGDHPVTAAAIAAELGLAVTTDEVITGSEWEGLSRRQQERAVTDRLVFARMSPEQKVQIVQTLERAGRVCAMVGDGVNDAAAIRAATVGIGVAARGSAPARTAADVMLLDGRIESLLDALDEGRQLWQRVRAAVAVLLGGNAGEVLFAVIGSAITGRAPLNARQLLLVNMLTDALPAAALAVSPPSNGNGSAVHGPDEAALWRAVALRGVATAGGATGAWMLGRMTGRQRRAATVALVALVASQLGQTLLDSHGRSVVLTAVGSLAAMGVLISTPGVSQLLGCTPLGPVGWTQALGSAAVATGAAAIAPRMLPALG